MFLLVFVLFALFGYYIWQRRHLLRLAYKLNGPTGYPLVGSAYRFFDAYRRFTLHICVLAPFSHCNSFVFVHLCWTGILEEINAHGKQCGNCSKFWMGNRLFVYINDPNHFEIILNSPTSLNKGASYDFIVESIGHGLITSRCNFSLNILLNFFLFCFKMYAFLSSSADEWRFHRRNLNPSFHYNVVKSFYPIFNKNLKIFTKELRKYAGVGPFHLQLPIESCAMDMICGKFWEKKIPRRTCHLSMNFILETTLGLDIQAQGNSELLHQAHTLLDITARRFFQPWIQPSFLFRLSKFAAPFYAGVDYLNKLLTNVSAYRK